MDTIDPDVQYRGNPVRVAYPLGEATQHPLAKRIQVIKITRLLPIVSGAIQRSGATGPAYG